MKPEQTQEELAAEAQQREERDRMYDDAVNEKDPTIEEMEPFPLEPLPVEKRDQEPKIEEEKSDYTPDQLHSDEEMLDFWERMSHNLKESLLDPRVSGKRRERYLRYLETADNIIVEQKVAMKSKED